MVEAQTCLDQALLEAKHRTSDPARTLAKSGYIVEEIIGQGAYALVKKAYWSKVDTTVAIKIISKATAAASFLQKCVPRELEVTRKLKHKNIILFHEIIETNMRIYIIMQYAEKGSLLHLIRRSRKLSEPRVRRYYRELLEGIRYIHSCGYAHRDIKLENIVLDANDQVKLIDFGFACRLHEGNDCDSIAEPHLSETFCGSHAYASPEILQFQPYDPIPADIWASGVVIYSLLFGQLPFTNNRNVRIIQQIIAQGVQFPSDVAVTNEVKALLKQIFVPVAQRLTAVQISKAAWFYIQLPEE
uniref:Protein kinase domain-containing protein n=1 Tax=Anopheles minimus TaxID=112268 RepID=A0A182VTI3_9DIPT